MQRADEPITSPTLLRRLVEESDDRRGWPRFVEAYQPLILSWCRAKGLQEADARDLTQEVLLRFARQAGRFAHDPSKRFRGWLRTLTHAAWCDWVERQRPWHQGSGDSAVIREVETRPSVSDPSARQDLLDDAERLEQACARVKARVEPRTWEAFRLLALEGLSGDEAAVRLGMKRGSAHAARCKVQRLVREEVARLHGIDSEA
jgi:RNA polymerase sigma-70 factor (ECF subfamily)